MAAHGEKSRPPLGNSNGRHWGESHGRRHRSERDPLKTLADKADALATQILATRDELIRAMEQQAGALPHNPTPQLRDFEAELGVDLHNIFHELVARKLVEIGERPVFYNHEDFNTWQRVATRLRQASIEARNRAYNTHA